MRLDQVPVSHLYTQHCTRRLSSTLRPMATLPIPTLDRSRVLLRVVILVAIVDLVTFALAFVQQDISHLKSLPSWNGFVIMYILPPFLIGVHNVVRQVICILHDLRWCWLSAEARGYGSRLFWSLLTFYTPLLSLPRVRDSHCQRQHSLTF